MMQGCIALGKFLQRYRKTYQKIDQRISSNSNNVKSTGTSLYFEITTKIRHIMNSVV